MSTTTTLPSAALSKSATAPVKRKRKAGPERWLVPLTFVLLMGAWAGSVWLFAIPQYVLPGPGVVLRALASGLLPIGPTGGSYWFHIGVTALEAALGFVIGSALGVAFGLGVAHWPLAHKIVYPYLIAFQALPKVAIAPLFVIWWGFGIEAKVVMTSVITFFPMLVNSIAGYHSVEPDRIDMARSCGATQAKIFTKIIIPSALPFLFAGLNMAAVLALLGALVGEYVGAQSGIGMLLIQYDNNMQIDQVFALLVVLAAFGWMLSHAVTLLERRFCFWAQRPKNFGLS
jgi:NitT/TauT family transport system permease protein